MAGEPVHFSQEIDQIGYQRIVQGEFRLFPQEYAARATSPSIGPGGFGFLWIPFDGVGLFGFGLVLRLGICSLDRILSSGFTYFALEGKLWQNPRGLAGSGKLSFPGIELDETIQKGISPHFS
jgi:hypothetical protein